jgi:two-component system, chemotaxis family, CheB/CheR fusion protein
MNASDVQEGAARGSFPIAAIGASAGGLAPTVEVIRELGRQPGLAIVVIHHLDPTHESGLVEILSRATAMPVAAATDGVRVEANRVYVVPPNAGLLVSQGVLKVVPRLQEGAQHLPINRFFESLALDREGLAVGVVLSGSGSDGSEGIEAIKKEGGITLAQDATAPFESMPQSAIATGCVDFVLAPAAIGRELVRIGSHAPSLGAVAPQGFEERDYLAIVAAMRKSSGVDFASYKHSTLRRRIQRRLLLRGLTDLGAYLDLLKREPSEISTLCEEVLIHVTGFFREPEVFEVLRTRIFPKLCDTKRPDDGIRVWVPGCATGEEVYSMAICLLEFLEGAHKDLPIKIFGTDLSLVSIEKARAGTYPQSIERDVSPERLQRFFAKDDHGWRIRRDLRDMCVFAKHDLTNDPPFSSMDVVSCRNLMIYLGPELQDRVIALLHYALKDPGFLVLGNSETVRTFTGFAAMDGKSRIYARTPVAKRLTFDFATPTFLGESARPPPSPARAPDRPAGKRPSLSDLDAEADRLVLAEFAPPGVIVTSDLAIVQCRGQTGPFLELAPGAASLDLLRMAREELRLPLRRLIDQARTAHSPARETGFTVVGGDRRRTVTLEVIPFTVHSADQRFFLVLFQDVTQKESADVIRGGAEGQETDPVPEGALANELASTRRYLESVIEQSDATHEELKAANEEIVSSNEELRSTNEELQSAKEELQATNDELRTINDELGQRNVEATRLSDDLTNVLSSAEIPILIVGRDSRLRRFTPAAGKVFDLLASDVDRPLSEARRLGAVAPGLMGLIAEVLEHLRPAECTLQDAAGRWVQLAVRPYVTIDGRIDGTVVAARDIDAETKATEGLVAARKYAENIVETVREGLVVLDRDLRVRSANPAFQRAVARPLKDIEGRRLDELERPELATPALRKVLADLGDGATIEGFRMEHADGPAGLRVFLLNAHHIEGTELFLVAIEDVTEAERARSQRAEIGFRDALTGASEGILMVDPAGRIVFANLAAAGLFGYDCEELTNLSVDGLVPDRLREIHSRHRVDYLAAPLPRPMGPDQEPVGRRKDGTQFPIEVSLSRMPREGGSVVLAFVTDITKRREAEKKIQAYQERLQNMAFDAAVTEERERRRLAIELHDGIGQDLALAKIKLTPFRNELGGDSRPAINGAIDLLDKAINDSRTLVFELSPPVLYDIGLKAALAWLAEDVEKRHGVHVEVTDDGLDKPLDDAAKAILFRAVRELVLNVLKHARAPQAKVSLRRRDDHFQIDVEDGGVGFDPDAPRDRPSPGGFGLLSVREQITRLGGTLKVESAPQAGTRVSVAVPLQASAAPLQASEAPRPLGDDVARDEEGTL